ncbi:lipopolysaccharide kinase InaA family protein [beta proteobacterium MWH-UniP1]
MSGADNTVWQIAPGQERFVDFLLALNTTFAQQGSTIYHARNELKEFTVDGDVLIVKSFGVPDALRRLIYGRFRQSKAQKSFNNAVRLQSLDLPTPSPVGFIEHHRSGGLYESFYVSHAWPNAQTIRDPLTNPNHPNRREILKAFGRFAWKLHQHQVYHRDFSPGNILFSKSSGTASGKQNGAGQWQFCLVDVNRMEFRPLSLDARMENFKMLWADDDDLNIIISAYATASGEAATTLIEKAISSSNAHKQRANRKERIKTLLHLH